MLYEVLLLRELLLDGEEVVELTTGTVLEDEVKFLLALEGGRHADDEGVVELSGAGVTSISTFLSVKMYFSLFCFSISFFLTTFMAKTCPLASSRTRKILP